MVELGLQRAVRVCQPAALAAALVLPSAALAQDVAPPDQSQWVKICSEDPNTNKRLCLVTQELHADTGQFIASATLRQFAGEDKTTFIAAVPPGMLLQPGLRAQVDDGKQYEIKYSICFPNACYADVEVDNDFIDAMKAGGQLMITALNQQAKGISFPLTLVGFTKTFESEGVDPTAGRAQLEDLTKSLKAHADEARQKLIEQQQKSAGQSN